MGAGTAVEFCAFTEPQEGATYEQLLAHAQAAERLGYHGWFRSDHYLGIRPVDPEPAPTDAWTTLAGLARETRRIRLGTLVSSATFRNPGVLAIQVAQVNRMSAGRAELGLGTGWYADEHTAYGIPFPARRFGMLEEQLQVVTGLLATPRDSAFSFAGEHYRLTGAPGLAEAGVQPTPVIVGGAGLERTPALAAQYASEYNRGFVGVDETARSFERVRQAAAAIGRDPQELRYSIAQPTVVGRNEAEFRRRAERIGADPQKLRSVNLGGTVAEVADRLAAFAELKPDRVYLQTIDVTDIDHLELVATEVLPQSAVQSRP